ncbi:hypothetical protein [Brucella intermedia]|uniref:hypothetical protein n=1 Tax=Brucella intermedia TaxID=94625 RepID=UPI00235FED35|nr:hypothetical protein [Brucella intermedia]
MTDVFGTRLYRTPYLVVPRLALEAMPEDWQLRFESLMDEADKAGIRTPDYLVFRNLSDGNSDGLRGVKQVNRDRWDQTPFYRFTGGWRDDPWANYRHGNAWDLSGDAA